MTGTWRNWSGSVEAHPRAVLRPHDEGELSRIVREAQSLRVAGSGHSFMPLCETDGVLVSLADMAGRLELLPDRASVWAPAGWTLARLTRELWAQGLSLSNQGDINDQALAGALATGTHGTGAGLPILSAFAEAFRLVLASGEVVECSPAERPALFQAARLSLGLIGVAVGVKLRVLPAFHLEERIAKRPLAEVLETFDVLAGESRHVEFFVFPYADEVILKTLVEAPDDGSFRAPSPVDETVFRLACELGAAAKGFIPGLQRLLMKAPGDSSRTGPAHRIFPSDRTVKFEEMEYEMPRAAGLPALKEAIDWIRRKSLPVTFPFEFRYCAADDIWLSPFQGREGASVSMHQYAKMPFRELFAEGEAIFRGLGGRPHWAKRHTLSRDDVDTLYPDAEKFRAVRAAHDPEGRLLNDHLAELFG